MSAFQRSSALVGLGAAPHNRLPQSALRFVHSCRGGPSIGESINQRQWRLGLSHLRRRSPPALSPIVNIASTATAFTPVIRLHRAYRIRSAATDVHVLH
jgi:hypothetical protein